MGWEVEYTHELGMWWETLTEQEQGDVAAYVGESERRGPMLPYPYSSDVRDSKHGVMRELRVQSGGKPIRIFYAFDPRRRAILLIVVGRLEGSDFTNNSYRSPTAFMTNT
jgi:hypothetical protein